MDFSSDKTTEKQKTERVSQAHTLLLVDNDLNCEYEHLIRSSIVAALAWSALIAVSFFWNYSDEQQQAITLASNEARAHFNKDKAFRLWGTSHGGVYVPVSEHTPSNPRLSHVPERDITTPSGKKLTLMNPAYMIRQMMQDYEDLYGVKGGLPLFLISSFIRETCRMSGNWWLCDPFRRETKRLKKSPKLRVYPICG